MIIGVPSRKLEIKKNLSILKKIGYDGFQFDLSSCGIKTLHKNFILDEEDDICVKKIKVLSDELDFPIAAMHTFYPIDAEVDTVINTLKKYSEYLKILDCKYLILHISGYSKDKNRLMQAIACLNEVKERFSEEGFEILLENDHKPSLFITIEDVKKVITELDLNLCFDVSHAMQSDVDLDDFYTEFCDKIKAIHLSDYKKMNKPHLEIGTGILTEFECFKKIIQSDKLLILEVGKDIRKAKTTKKIISIYKNSYLRVKEGKNQSH